MKRVRCRRISRARILDGHALRVSVYAALVMVLAYTVITVLISLLFAIFNHTGFSLVAWTLPFGAILGFALLVMERLLGRLKEYMFSGMGKLLTAFLLFFIHTIGYFALSSILVSYPLGYLMENFMGLAGIAGKYSLFSANFFIVLAIFSWLRNVRTPPSRCF